MYETYQDIYQARGNLYHQAMMRYPGARAAEFETLVEVLALPESPGRVLDIPSGGGYLRPYLPASARLISVDPARPFLEAGEHLNEDDWLCAPHDQLPFSDHAVDAVASLAGLHHIKDQASVFAEWHRVLKPGGVMGVGDVQVGSPTSRFLDEVVHAYNSMGHHGYYLDAAIKPLLKSIGFRVDLMEPRAYPWRFANRTDMLDFCRLLFGMDRQPTDGDLVDGIEQTVGFRETAQGCELNWELLFVRAVRVVDSIGEHR